MEKSVFVYVLMLGLVFGTLSGCNKETDPDGDDDGAPGRIFR